MTQETENIASVLDDVEKGQIDEVVASLSILVHREKKR